MNSLIFWVVVVSAQLNMSRIILIIAFVPLVIFNSYCSGKCYDVLLTRRNNTAIYLNLITQTGQCGFSGQPKNGTAALQLDPRSLNEKQPGVYFLSAAYSCDDNHVLIPSTYRKCVGGRWDGEIPRCRKFSFLINLLT
jgi:hypothetical protein